MFAGPHEFLFSRQLPQRFASDYTRIGISSYNQSWQKRKITENQTTVPFSPKRETEAPRGARKAQK